MSDTENGKSTFEKLLQPAIVSARTGIWLGEAAYNGVNKVLPITKFGRSALHFIDESRLVNYRKANAAKEEMKTFAKEMRERPEDLELVDHLTLGVTFGSIKEAGEEVVAAVHKLNPEVHFAAVMDVMEASGVPPKTIEIAVAKARENLPQTTAPELVDLREDPTNRITTVTLE